MRHVIVFFMLLLGVYEVRGQIFVLSHADSTIGNFFGNAVSIDGSRALIGASGATTCGENAGMAYIFEKDPASEEWLNVASLLPHDCSEDQFFGRSVSLSGDRALVAASGEFFSIEASNAAYIFERDTETGAWRETARLTSQSTSPEGAFAASVTLDGERALVTAAGDAVHGRYSGAAYIFERNEHTGEWDQKARLTGSRGLRAGIFGGSGALDGDTAVVTSSTYFADEPGSCYVFERDVETGRWEEKAIFGDIDDFFISIDIDNNFVLIGQSKKAPNQSGAATLYTRDPSGTWRLMQTLRPVFPYEFGAFGTSVSLTDDFALVVGYDEQLGLDFNIDRVVYVYKKDTISGEWKQEHVIDVGEVSFGAAVDHSGRYALVGEAAEEQPGAAYIIFLN